VVKAGDCLWDIAYHELGADATLFQIDQRWRQWWRYNQNTIGDNPHALQPGTVLQSPPFTE
jgi:nucleoid-associated protein YgaU